MPALEDYKSYLSPDFTLQPSSRWETRQQFGIAQKNLTDLLQLLMPILGEQAKFGAQMEPDRQAALSQFSELTRNPGLSALSSQFRTNAMGQGAASGNYAASVLRGSGAGSGEQMGARLAGLNRATEQSNQFNVNLYDPQAQQQRLAMLLQALQANQQPNVQGILGLTQGIYSRPLNTKKQSGGGGLLGSLAGLAGSAVSGGWNPFSSGGGWQGVPYL